MRLNVSVNYTMDKIFSQTISTENPGMCAGTEHYSFEDIYQAFKERILTSLDFREEILEKSRCSILKGDLEALEKARVDLFEMAGTDEVDLKVITRVTEAMYRVANPD